ncbi:hypothetical protein CEXT_543041 [Caerostris extrusa]|uniref:Secreted protein n=1 Tax=Caerostris extrusa TaxID=172846 RepID=A0AAV4Q2H9_CAEEX|nr:hypothetical protein CEXT_543041 [Caerostris extrusa]
MPYVQRNCPLICFVLSMFLKCVRIGVLETFSVLMLCSLKLSVLNCKSLRSHVMPRAVRAGVQTLPILMYVLRGRSIVRLQARSQAC